MRISAVGLPSGVCRLFKTWRLAVKRDCGSKSDVPNESSPNPKFAHPSKPLGFLGWIVTYKAIKGILAIAGGVVALQLGNRELGPLAHSYVLYLGFDPEGKLGSRLIAHVANINPHRVEQLGLVLFFYALMYFIECIGLYLEKPWAEWFTVFQTALLIPAEIYGITHHNVWFSLIMLTTSLLVIAYLLWRIRHDRLTETHDPQSWL